MVLALSFLYLIDGKGYAFEGAEGGQDDEGVVTGDKVDVELRYSETWNCNVRCYEAVFEN